jgi:tRNA-modifying protein YgfZ
MMTQWHAFLKTQDSIVDNTARFDPAKPSLMLCDLSHLGLLTLTGADAKTFLQGQVTNDVNLLDGQTFHYSGYCNAKGRLLALFLAFAQQDTLYLQLDGGLAETIAKRLRMYVLRSKVQIATPTDLVVLGIAGAEASRVLANQFGSIPSASYGMVNTEQASILRLADSVEHMPRYQIFTSAEQAQALWLALGAEAQYIGKSIWNWLEIQAGIPEIVAATQEAFVPQMLNLDLLGGINFKKGCYTGQEIVARTHYLGKVKRRTLIAHYAGSTIPQAGDDIYAQAEAKDAVGKVVRCAPAYAGGFDILIEARLENIELGLYLNAEKLQLLEMPYLLEAA